MCKTKGCRKKPAPKRNYCYSCVIRRYAERARGKEFTITFEYFVKVAIKYSYFKGRGRTATSLHIDRKREELGYVPGNIQVLENADNIRKYMSWQYDEKGKPTHFKFYTNKPLTQDEQESYPF